MATMNVSLPDQMREWVEARVAEGRHGGVSDYIRDLIRRDQERAEAIALLQAEIDAGMASGPPGPLDVEALLTELHDREW